MRSSTKLVGIDGCRAGWVVVTTDRFPESLDFSVLPTLEPIFDAAKRSGVSVAIDIPIGLPETGRRECDVAARKYLPGHRKSSVFPAPCRATLAARTYREACDLNAGACGKKVTRELYNILEKIRQVDRLMTPERQRWIREAHPEVIFATLAGPFAEPLVRKAQREGQDQRIALLAHTLPDLDRDRLQRERSRLAGAVGHGGVALDDLIDALACLITAQRCSTGVARVFPDGPPRVDERGLRMEIVA